MPTCRGYPSAGGPNHPMVEEIWALGETISRKFSVAQHIYLYRACVQSLFALRTLRHHGNPMACRQALYK